MVAPYSHSPDDANAAAFHDETNKALKLLRQASDRCGRNPGDDLGTTQRKRKQRGLLEQAIQAIEGAQRKGMDADGGNVAEYPVLTKYTLRDAVKKFSDVKKVASHFGMSTGSIKRSMRMFQIEPESYDEFYGGSSA